MKNINIKELPTLLAWLTEPGDNGTVIDDFIADMQGDITEMLAVDDICCGGPDDEEYQTVHTCCLRMAHLVADLKAIRREAKAAQLISDAGLKPKKGGAA